MYCIQKICESKWVLMIVSLAVIALSTTQFAKTEFCKGLMLKRSIVELEAKHDACQQEFNSWAVERQKMRSQLSEQDQKLKAEYEAKKARYEADGEKLVFNAKEARQKLESDNEERKKELLGQEQVLKDRIATLKTELKIAKVESGAADIQTWEEFELLLDESGIKNVSEEIISKLKSSGFFPLSVTRDLNKYVYWTTGGPIDEIVTNMFLRGWRPANAAELVYWVGKQNPKKINLVALNADLKGNLFLCHDGVTLVTRNWNQEWSDDHRFLSVRR